MKKIDINVDIAEGFPHDAELLAHASSANVCCGEHAGSWDLTKRTVELCREKGVRVGMHPGFPDRENMGRMSIRPAFSMDYYKNLIDQTSRFCEEFSPAYIKPHGAFYNDSAMSEMVSEMNGTNSAPSEMFSRPESAWLWEMLLCAQGICGTPIPLVGLPGSGHEQIANAAEAPFVREGFADRGYNADGSLIPRGETGAMLKSRDDKIRQVLWLADRVDSICIHGDAPDCLETIWLVRMTLENNGFEIAA